jgi:hypothetical protein
MLLILSGFAALFTEKKGHFVAPAIWLIEMLTTDTVL